MLRAIRLRHPATSLSPFLPCLRSPRLAVAVSAGTASSSLAPLRLEAHGPSRFFTIEATTAGGSVAVEVVQEGSLRLRTGGGSISVPKVRPVVSRVPAVPGTARQCSLHMGTVVSRAALACPALSSAVSLRFRLP